MRPAANSPTFTSEAGGVVMTHALNPSTGADLGGRWCSASGRGDPGPVCRLDPPLPSRVSASRPTGTARLPGVDSVVSPRHGPPPCAGDAAWPSRSLRPSGPIVPPTSGECGGLAPGAAMHHPHNGFAARSLGRAARVHRAWSPTSPALVRTADPRSSPVRSERSAVRPGRES